jgi:putative iron-only hydrogenase system regulator
MAEGEKASSESKTGTEASAALAAQGRRFGFVGIIVSHSASCGQDIQRILSESRDLIQGRMGLPHLDKDSLSVITLIVCATPEELGGMTGKLGRLKGVSVKSGLAPL